VWLQSTHRNQSCGADYHIASNRGVISTARAKHRQPVAAPTLRIKSSGQAPGQKIYHMFLSFNEAPGASEDHFLSDNREGLLANFDHVADIVLIIKLLRRSDENSEQKGAICVSQSSFYNKPTQQDFFIHIFGSIRLMKHAQSAFLAVHRTFFRHAGPAASTQLRLWIQRLHWLRLCNQRSISSCGPARC
jgi:hypothetical protein